MMLRDMHTYASVDHATHMPSDGGTEVPDTFLCTTEFVDESRIAADIAGLSRV